ncbi:stabilin-2-like isoform X1 [Pomacea canaliculata]|nr:stabilin-2-like isoform X1 [Pomacea canaliculata]
MYGTNCTEECACKNGTCNNGPNGDGSCIQCHPGFTGQLCNEVIAPCSNMACGNHSYCVEAESEAQCQCEPGYDKLSDDSSCQPIDRCATPKSPCGENAVCVPTGPGTYRCTCLQGYRGDGYLCLPIDPCQDNNGGCDNLTSVCMNTAPNASVCDCLAGYERYVEGKGCSLKDVCHFADCHSKANCTTVGPNAYRCTCIQGYAGDGRICYGNIMERLAELNENHPDLRGDLRYSLDLLQAIYYDALSKPGPFTIFVPINRAFRKVASDFSYQDMFRERDRTKQIIRQHILLGKLSLEALQNFDYFYTLQGNVAELQVRVRRDQFLYRVQGFQPRARVTVRDIPASNGMIHIVNELLINEPQIVGDATKSAMSLIRTEGRFNRMQSLIKSLSLESLFERDNITVFAPENGGLDGLPEGTLDYLMNDPNGQIKLKTILENHVFPGRIEVTDLVSMNRIHSFANYATLVKVSKLGQIQLNGQVNISQTNIPCKNAVYYHIDRPLIPPELAQILPSRCDLKKNLTIKGSCSPCRDAQCPLSTDIFRGEVTQGCSYWGTVQGHFMLIPGCSAMCLRSQSIPRCCKGFFGLECKPCPGGYKNPCGGRGQCIDEMFGTGFCVCDRNFRGLLCEQCMDRTKFGPNCTRTCTCMKGDCDGGPEGTGFCKPGTCLPGFRGDNCDLSRKRCSGNRVLMCHAHAECIEESPGTFRCECRRGYQGDGQICLEIDPCQRPDRGGCHPQAVCSKVGPGAHQCQCDYGWFGDGFTCQPETPCKASADCHDNATCRNLEPGRFTCVCDKGYDGNGTHCTEINGCLANNGGCDPRARCRPTGPGTVNCSCPEFYVGDGARCFTTIAGHVLSHENLTLLATLIKKQSPADVILDDVGESLTFFAPTDDALRVFLAGVPGDYFDDPSNILNFFSFHTLPEDYTIPKMLALESIGGFGKFPTMFAGYSVRVLVQNKSVSVMKTQTTLANVVVADIVTMNGYLHLIDGVLEPFLPDADQPFLRDFFEENEDLSNFAEALESHGLTSRLQEMDQYTLFVPNNTIFPGAANFTIREDYLKYYVVPRVLLTPALDEGQTVSTVLGDKHQLQFRLHGNQVTVNGVEILQANLLTVEGVVHVIAGLLYPTLNFCNRETVKTDFGLCAACFNYSALECLPGFEPSITNFVERSRCQYVVTDDLEMNHTYVGCRRLCQQTIQIVQCCEGHYGENCAECPGGPLEPCSGRGVCDAGEGGTGLCLCSTLYTGRACELCVDATMAGPFCNISKMSCAYQNGNCSQKAECMEDETGAAVGCRCHPGYVGDGYHCSSPCDTQNGGCHVNATCQLLIQGAEDQDRTVNCTCNAGFHGNGMWCVENVDECEDGAASCSPFADCQYYPPLVTSEQEGQVRCTCQSGYLGNGSLCVTTVWNALSQIESTAGFYTVLKSSLMSSNISTLLDNHQAAITVFLPAGPAESIPAGINYEDYILFEALMVNDNLVTLSNVTELLSANGHHLNFTTQGVEFFVNGVKIIERNIETINGYVNVIAHSFDKDNLLLQTTLVSTNLDLVAIIVPVGVLLMVVSIVGIIICCYRHSQTKGFLDIAKIFRRGSETSMSFARLQAQEEDEAKTNLFSQPENINFDNPLYNDPDAL